MSRQQALLTRYDAAQLMRGQEQPEIPEPGSEANLMHSVMRYGTRLGLLHFHAYTGCVSLPGFPDLVIAGPGGVLWWEAKSPACPTLSEPQETWREMLKASRQRYSVITPADWASGELQHRLHAIAGQD